MLSLPPSKKVCYDSLSFRRQGFKEPASITLSLTHVLLTAILFVLCSILQVASSFAAAAEDAIVATVTRKGGRDAE